MSFSLNSSLGGHPSTTTPIPPPCDSPQVVMRNRWPNVFPIPSLCEKTPSRSNQHIQEASELFAIAYSGGYAGRSCLPLQRKSGRNFQVATNILFVDDEAPIREMLSLYFRKTG